jgi:carbon storage regulator
VLILSRKEGDSIVIDGGVRIVVLSSDRRGVRLGIEAPAETRILRGEIVDQVGQENRRATSASREWLDLVPAAAQVRPGAD